MNGMYLNFCDKYTHAHMPRKRNRVSEWVSETHAHTCTIKLSVFGCKLAMNKKKETRRKKYSHEKEIPFLDDRATIGSLSVHFSLALFSSLTKIIYIFVSLLLFVRCCCCCCWHYSKKFHIYITGLAQTILEIWNNLNSFFLIDSFCCFFFATLNGNSAWQRDVWTKMIRRRRRRCRKTNNSSRGSKICATVLKIDEIDFYSWLTP